MTWMTSDLVVLLFVSVLILCFLGTVLVRSREFWKRYLSMTQLDILLKAASVYLLLAVPLLAGAILYFSTFHGSHPVISDQGTYTAYVIGNQTISTETGYGNHPVLVLIFLSWLAGVFYRGIYKEIQSARLLACMEQSTKEAKASLEMQKEQIRKEYKIRRRVDIRVTGVVSSPFTAGILRRKIFCPETEYAVEDMELMLRHELTHCRRQDVLYRRILYWLCAFYWFAPWIRSFTEYAVEVNEMACDECVLTGMSKAVRFRYANLLAGLTETEEKTEMPYPALLFQEQTVSGLERRLENMLGRKEKNRKNKMLFTAVSFGLAVTFPLTTCAAAGGASKLQHEAVQLMVEEHEEEPQEWNYEEFCEVDTDEVMREVESMMLTRDMTSVKEDVDGKEAVSVATLSLEKGDTVNLYLKANKTTDKFRAGLKDSSGKKTYVNSSSGTVNHTFTVSKKGTYKVFIEGTTTSKIHVEGSVTAL